MITITVLGGVLNENIVIFGSDNNWSRFDGLGKNREGTCQSAVPVVEADSSLTLISTPILPMVGKITN